MEDKPNINNIAHRHLYDKLKVFEMAGDETRSYDYAIPQYMCDELIKFGIENPGQWFVGDCSGPAAFPKLRHVGEAVYQILQHRSEANKEIFMQLHGDQIVNEIIMKFAGNAVCNEADAGFVDLNMIIGLVTEAYSRGRKSGINDARAALVNESWVCNCGNTPHTDGFFTCDKEGALLEPTLDSGWENLYKCERCGLIFHVDDGPVATNLILESTTNPGDEMTPPHSITLRRWGKDQWVTHWKNHQTGGFSHGHYFYSQWEAYDDFRARCVQSEVAPF
jgi:hypothetical protein